jgi:hypothetical protein
MADLEWVEITLARLFVGRKIHSLDELPTQPIRYGYIRYDDGSRKDYAMYLLISEDGELHVDKVVEKSDDTDWADVT